MDKAPEAFRTISEVADDLDIPQHVLRFWETRFTQIKPMKRSGGRRYYRPDDVDLLRGIRRLLYGEGYTIRGVQRILREQGIKAVQGLSDAAVVPPSVVTDRRPAVPEDDEDEAFETEADVDAVEPDEQDLDDDEDGEDVDADEATEIPPSVRERPVGTRPPNVEFEPRREPAMPRYGGNPSGAAQEGPGGELAARGRERLSATDAARLRKALDDLVACKELVDEALKDAPPEMFPSE